MSDARPFDIMKTQLTALAAVAIAMASASQARAQNTGEQSSVWEKPLIAPTRALELVVGTGYTQGFGSLQRGVDMANVAGPGLGVDVGVGYRIDPHWAIGLTGQYQEFTAERSTSARGLTPGIAASYHAMPYQRTDPWVQLGTGYRFLWENHEAGTPSVMTHGFELAKLTLGVDIRVDKDVALAPVIGADMGVPLWQSTDNVKSVAINNPTVNMYVFAGLQARFDLTSRHEMLTHDVPKTEITRAVITPPQAMKPVSPAINVADELLEKCNLSFGSVEKAPKFEFDKAALLPADFEVLRQIAECVTIGPLKDASLTLVGHADPRGTVQYNEKLGLRRAVNVAGHLEQLGVPSSRMDRFTRGELDAVGTDEASWAIDRRVDISVSR